MVAKKKKSYKVGDRVFYRMRFKGSPMRTGTIRKVLVDFVTKKPTAYTMGNGDIVNAREIKELV